MMKQHYYYLKILSVQIASFYNQKKDQYLLADHFFTKDFTEIKKLNENQQIIHDLLEKPESIYSEFKASFVFQLMKMVNILIKIKYQVKKKPLSLN